VLGDFAPQPVILTSASDSTTVPAHVTITASVTDHTGSAPAAGTVTWTITGPSNFTCPASNLASGPPTCLISLTYGQQGTYTVKGTYSNSGYPNGSSGSTEFSVLAVAPQANISASYNPTANPPTLTFTDSVVGAGGNVPGQQGGGVSWSIGGSDGSNPSCDVNAGPTNNTSTSTSTWSCTLNNPNQTVSYTVGAAYTPSGNPYYGPVSATGTFAIPAVIVSGAPVNGGKITFTESAALPVGFTDTSFSSDQITWQVTSTDSTFSQSNNCNTPTSLQTSTCTVNGVKGGFVYTAVVTFANSPTVSGYDSNLAATSAKTTVST
jgi:hypothetical protein